MYADDDDGGPSDGRKTIHVHINQINKFMKQSGVPMRIHGSKWKGYRIVRYDQRTHAAKKTAGITTPAQ